MWESERVADHAVLIAGAGPTGLMLAAELNVALAGGSSLRADYLVGCDGGRSVFRKVAGIESPGWDSTTSYLLAEIEMAFEPDRAPDWGIRHDALGVHSLSRVGMGDRRG